MEEQRLAEFCEKVLPLQDANLGEEYYYSSLSQCVLDAVFSIGVRYASTQNVVTRYCLFCEMPKYRDRHKPFPLEADQQPLSEFVKMISATGSTTFAESVFQNMQRTSSQNGILKAEAAYRFAKTLTKFGVNYLQDIHLIRNSAQFEANIRRIPGQTSGISLRYFYMLTGDDNLVKPDRMIHRFLFSAQQRNFSSDEAQTILLETSDILKNKYPHITPRILDYLIWCHQRKCA